MKAVCVCVKLYVCRCHQVVRRGLEEGPIAGYEAEAQVTE